ncbi:C-C motif chemokine 16 isoform X1 [Larimichthys crocea]|uniref:C-C motif chemokine 16 isoform X1 n=1 Tax=Larimichthys crocea TaxID=215358 RepID=UPI000F5E4286|nr:C-C motif chemokine 16-like isoform X1 [Larimichthys crocea]
MAKLIVCVSITLVLLVVLCESSRPIPCCTEYYDKRIPLKVIKSYSVQENTGYCNIRAVIFKLINNRPVCANPDAKWVQRAMQSVPKI